MSPREQILQQAMILTAEDRAFLVDALEESLPVPLPPSDQVAAAWSQEIDRRIAAFDSGASTAVGFDATLDHVRQVLAEYRSSRDGE